MSVLGKEYQPLVKDAQNVLVGVAQIRVGKMSERDAGTAVVGVPTSASKSKVIIDATDGVTKVVVPLKGLPSDTANTWAGNPVAVTGTYTGRYDGCFIVRAGAYNDTLGDVLAATGKVEVFAPNGFRTQLTLVAGAVAATAINLNNEASPTASGLSIALDFGATPTAQVGDTWVVPVWAGTAQNKVQTCIISPYSMFKGAGESVGGIKSASFQAKLDTVKTLESGFPEVVMDRIVTKTSAQLKFEALEYTNSNMQIIRDLLSAVVNESKMPAVPMEIVMRTRGNTLVTFWLPNCGITSGPTYAPTNDYSALSWETEVVHQTEVTKTGDFADVPSSGVLNSPKEFEIMNSWLRNAPLFQELNYIH